MVTCQPSQDGRTLLFSNGTQIEPESCRSVFRKYRVCGPADADGEVRNFLWVWLGSQYLVDVETGELFSGKTKQATSGEKFLLDWPA